MLLRQTILGSLLAVAIASFTALAQCPVVKLEVEKLPSLNTPRTGHSTLVANGDIVVVGGHTTGFVPTATAEHLSNGMWHQVPLVYEHDNTMALMLSSGKMLIAGGSEKSLGIGQTFPVELYDPSNDMGTGFGCLFSKRALASGVEIDSGKVIIAGNWHRGDTIECFDGGDKFSFVKEASQPRANPFMLRCSADNVMIFGRMSSEGEPYDHVVVYQLKGEHFMPELFKTWTPLPFLTAFNSSVSFIGDIKKGLYSYLIPVVNKEGQLAIAVTRDTTFSLLSTSCAVPMTSHWGKINYLTPVVVDRNAKRGYVMGRDKDWRYYVLSIDYGDMASGKSAQLILYHTGPLPDAGVQLPVITPDGNIVIVGSLDKKMSNYAPTDAAYKLLLNRSVSSAAWVWWLIVAIGALLTASVVYCVIWRKKTGRTDENDDTTNAETLAMDCIETMMR